MVIEAPLTYPITGIAVCCPRAASGHVAAAPPSSVMEHGASRALGDRKGWAPNGRSLRLTR